MLVLFTDFGFAGPYVGQMKAALFRAAPSVPVIDLMHDAPSWAPEAAAYLLPALVPAFPQESVFLCVVDPGVGSDRAPLAVRADGCWFVGPDNGLFQIISARAQRLEWWEISWRPERLSASFHGRDLFAPVAARLALGLPPDGYARPVAPRLREGWSEDLARIVYLDGFGNAMTGIRAAGVASQARLRAGGRELPRARTFAEVTPGQAFWYANSVGLVEVAVNRGSAAAALGLRPGDPVEFC